MHEIPLSLIMFFLDHKKWFLNVSSRTKLMKVDYMLTFKYYVVLMKDKLTTQHGNSFSD